MKYEELPRTLKQYDSVLITYSKNSEHHIKGTQETNEVQLYLAVFEKRIFNSCSQTVKLDDGKIHPVNPSWIPLEEIVKITKL